MTTERRGGVSVEQIRGKPRTVFLSPEYTDREGVDIRFTKTTRRVSVGAWYDSIVGFQAWEGTLEEFIALITGQGAS